MQICINYLNIIYYFYIYFLIFTLFRDKIEESEELLQVQAVAGMLLLRLLQHYKWS